MLTNLITGILNDRSVEGKSFKPVYSSPSFRGERLVYEKGKPYRRIVEFIKVIVVDNLHQVPRVVLMFSLCHDSESFKVPES